MTISAKEASGTPIELLPIVLRDDRVPALNNQLRLLKKQLTIKHTPRFIANYVIRHSLKSDCLSDTFMAGVQYVCLSTIQNNQKKPTTRWDVAQKLSGIYSLSDLTLFTSAPIYTTQAGNKAIDTSNFMTNGDTSTGLLNYVICEAYSRARTLCDQPTPEPACYGRLEGERFIPQSASAADSSFFKTIFKELPRAVPNF